MDKEVHIIAPVFIFDGDGGFVPCPTLLIEEEAIRYLRLDVDSSTDAHKTLKYYRDKGLVAIKVGKKNRYRRQDLDDFLAEKSEGKKGRVN